MTARHVSPVLCILLVLNANLGAAASNSSNTSNQNANNTAQNNSAAQTTTPQNNAAGGNQQGSPSPGGSNVYFESQTLSYAAADRIANQIGKDICAVKDKPKTILIYDTATFSNLQVAAGFFAEMRILRAAFHSFLDNAPAATGAGAGGAAGQQGAGIANDVQTLKAEFVEMEKLLASLQATVNALQKSQPQEAGKAAEQPKLGIALTAAESVLSALGPYITASRADTSTTFTLSDAAIAMNVTHYLLSRSGCTAGTTVIYPRIALPKGDPAIWDESQTDTMGNLLKTMFQAQRQTALLLQAYEDAWTARQAKDQAAVALQQAKDQEALTVQQSKNLAALQSPAPALPGGPTTPAPKAGGGGGGGGTVSPTTPQTNPQTQNAPGAPQIQSQSQPGALAAKTYLGSDYLALANASGLLNTFLSAYTQTSSGASVPQIVQLAQALTLLSALVQPKTSLLFLEGTAAGGTQRLTKNLLRNLFSGPAIDYSGGAVISYGLVDVETGRASAANVYHVLSPYTTIGPPKNAKGLSSGDNLSKDYDQ